LASFFFWKINRTNNKYNHCSFQVLSEARMLLAPVKPSGPLLHHTITNRKFCTTNNNL